MNKWWTRAALGLVWALIATSIVTLGGDPPPVAAADVPPTIAVAAKAASPLAAGGQAIADVTIRNDGDVDATGPVVLAITGLIAGVTVLRIDEQVADRQWNCTTTTPIRCTYAPTGGSTATVGLAAGEVTEARVRLAVAAGTQVPLTLNLNFTVEVGASSAPDFVRASAPATFSKLPANQPGSIDGLGVSDTMVVGKAAHLDLDVTNLGPASISTVTANGLLPPGASNPSASGSGWSCTTKKSVWGCTWTGTARIVGAALPRLSVTFTSPATATSASQPLRWQRSLTATPTSGSTVITRSDDQVAFVLADQPPVARTIALATSGGSVEPGQTVEVTVGVDGSGFDDPARTVTVRSTLPTGRMSPGAAPTRGRAQRAAPRSRAPATPLSPEGRRRRRRTCASARPRP